MTKYYICKECYPSLKLKYLTKKALLIDHPTLKDHPELIGEIDE